MDYFRCDIIRTITTLMIAVVSVQGGMFEDILSALTTPTVGLEEVMHHRSTEYADTQNESNDECYPRRVKRYFDRTIHTHATNLFLSVKRPIERTITPVKSSYKASRHLSTLFCTLLI